ncbi:uncharacterized protein LOC130690004 [Daphnia carinata]|uniref:uncharacterized protein LOC130690004 n=1 Tax=Daphnia carinata TaxID=120202 RepID=UPI00257BF4D2|nr:uncharacterized protein LOC130690004 [Daphnia carinata]
MFQLCTASSVRFSVLFVAICWMTAIAAVPLEEEFHQLRENYIQLNRIVKRLEKNNALFLAKNTDLAEKITQLEAQQQGRNDEKQDLLSKFNVLESRIQQLETVFVSMFPRQKETASRHQTSVENSFESPPKSVGMARTCAELHAADPSLPSGLHLIDPDGQGVGDNPINVYCNMTTGTTAIPHDCESPLDVGHCADPGCYSRPVNYYASSRQMKALVDLSTECHQAIKYDCYYAPFEFNTIPYAWWNDRYGNAKYFWSGGNTEAHICQCGIDGNCVDATVKCNCDATVPLQLVDSGVINDMDILPITRLNFGRTQLETSSGVHTLGRFECSGQVAITGMPTSCKDLWRIGHTLNGIYNVKGSSMVESVYCDFSIFPDDAGFQRWIGYADLKSASIYFYVTKNSSFATLNTPIAFEIARINEGNAMDLETGIFTSPRTGIYSFSFTGHIFYPATLTYTYFGVGLYLNGNFVGSGWTDVVNIPTDFQLRPVGFQATLHMKAGDQVWVKIENHSPGVYLIDDTRHYTHFTGSLVEEDIFVVNRNVE